MSSGIGRELLDEMRSDVQEMVRKRIDDEVESQLLVSEYKEREVEYQQVYAQLQWRLVGEQDSST